MFRKVLFPTDFSEGSMRAIQRFEKGNKVSAGECILLHVIDEGLVEDMFVVYSLRYNMRRDEIWTTSA